MNLDEFQANLGYVFRDQNLLIEAITHKSSDNKNNYERLEFLGDAALDLIVAEYLFAKFPAENEGVLTELHIALVKESALALIASALGLDKILKIASHALKNKIKIDAVAADSYEAVIGALFLEAGFAAAKEAAIRAMERVFPSVAPENLLCHNYKAKLQEATQARFGELPIYRVARESGADHKKTFEIEVLVGDKRLGIALAKSKKAAEQEAARMALLKL
ncbi:MAG: ribonuclease III [Helicobacteraceae bacterium]|jgi:ribonuclease-3|nr:ribonuclease III [Helicobacteraceae bacterium]